MADRRRDMDVKGLRCTSYGAAVAAIVEAAIGVAMIVKFAVIDNIDTGDCHHAGDLSPACLREIWTLRGEARTGEFLYAMVGAVGCFLLLPTVLTLASLFHRSGQRNLTGFIRSTFYAATAFAVFTFIVDAGSATTTNWMYRTWDLTDDQLVSFHMAWWISRGQYAWVNALDDLLIAGGMVAIAMVDSSAQVLPKGLRILTIIIGVISGIGFIAELGRLGTWFYGSAIGALVLVLNGIILFPIWLVWLGCIFPRLTPTTAGAANAAARPSTGASPPAPQFTGEATSASSAEPVATGGVELEMGATAAAEPEGIFDDDNSGGRQ